MAKLVSGEERAYLNALEQAREPYGRGWDRLGANFQRALVIERVFYTLAAQDDTIPAEVYRRIVKHVQSRLADDYSV